MSATETVRVRVALAVDASGNWNAAGWRDAEDGDAMGVARDHVDEGDVCYWLEVEVPLPARHTLTPTVERTHDD